MFSMAKLIQKIIKSKEYTAQNLTESVQCKKIYVSFTWNVYHDNRLF